MRLYETTEEAELPTIVDLTRQDDIATGEANVIIETEIASTDGKTFSAGSPTTWRPWYSDYRTLLEVLDRAQQGQPSAVTLGGVNLRHERWDPAWQHHAPDVPVSEWYVITARGQSAVIPGPHGLSLRLPRYAVWRVRMGVLETALETGDDLGLLRRKYDISDEALPVPGITRAVEAEGERIAS